VGVNKETVFGSMSGDKQEMSLFKVAILCRFFKKVFKNLKIFI
jgi:hypothetical protein